MNLKFLNENRAVAQWRREMKAKSALFFSASLCLCGSIFSSAQAQPAQAQNADEIVRSVNAAEAKTAYAATQIVQRGGSREVAKIYRSGPKRRLEWSEPSIRRGDFLIDDGRKVWLYHRADNSAIQINSARRGRALVPQGWKIGAGQSAGQLTLTRGNRREIVVDARTHVVLGTRMGNGGTSLKDIDYGPIPDAKFVFVKPAGASVTPIAGTLFGNLNLARRNAAWLKAPSQTPAGYKLESAVVGANEAWLRYSNNRQRFSIFEQKADAGEVKPQQVEGGWFWKSDNLRFLITGAPEGAVAKIAASLK